MRLRPVRFRHPRQTARTASNVQSAMLTVVAHGVRHALAGTIGAWEGLGVSQLQFLHRGDLSVDRRFTSHAYAVGDQRHVTARSLVDDCLAPPADTFHSSSF